MFFFFWSNNVPVLLSFFFSCIKILYDCTFTGPATPGGLFAAFASGTGGLRLGAVGNVPGSARSTIGTGAAGGGGPGGLEQSPTVINIGEVCRGGREGGGGEPHMITLLSFCS